MIFGPHLDLKTVNGCLSLGAVNPLIDTADLEKRKNYCNIYSKEDPIHVFTVLHITIHHQKEKCPKKVGKVQI